MNITAFSNIIIILIVIMIDYFLGRKILKLYFDKKNYRINLWIPVMIFWLGLNLYFYMVNVNLYLGALLLGLIGIAYITFSGSVLFKFAFAITYVSMTYLVSESIRVLILPFYSETTFQLSLLVAAGIISRIILFGLVQIISLFAIKGNYTFRFTYHSYFFLFPLASIVVTHFLIYYIEKNMDMTMFVMAAVALILLLGANVIIYYQYQNFERDVVSSQQQVLMTAYILSEKKRRNELLTQQEKAKETLSKIQNQLVHFHDYMKNAPIEESLKEFQKIFSDIPKMVRQQYVSPPLLNAILSVKLQAIENCAQIDVSSNLPVEYKVDGGIISILLGNSLDNAVEAIEKIQDPEKRKLKIRFISEMGLLHIYIENTYLISPKKIKGVYQSTKENPDKHGFGMLSIMKLIRDNEGTVDIQHKNKIFSLHMVLPEKSPFYFACETAVS